MKKLYFTLITFLFLSFAHAQIVNIPDANFKAKLLSASFTNQVASTQTPVYDSLNNNWTVSSYNNIDTNNDGEIQESEALLIKYLSVRESNISNLEGILSFINIMYLNCESNQLSILNVLGLSNIKYLRCNENYLTSLNIEGLTNLQYLNCNDNYLSALNVQGFTNLQTLLCGYNYLTSLNVEGLLNLQYFYCISNQITSLNVQGLTNLQDIVCGVNLLTSLNVQGLTNLQSLECNLNQINSLNVQGLANLRFLNCRDSEVNSLNLEELPNLEHLICDYNQLTTLNLDGLINLKLLYCGRNQLTSLNFQGLTNLLYLDCAYNQLTSLFIKNGNPQAWWAIDIGFNPNLIYICADDADINYVQSKINQYGYSATCHVNSYCSFIPGGINYNIQGTSKIDGNIDGCDTLDSIYPYLKFNITNGTISGSFISNSTGNYSIPVQAGTHTITPQLENSTYFTVSPTSNSITFPSTISPFSQNFCISPVSIRHDLEVVFIPLNTARPGFDITYKIKYKNKGNQIENATINFNYNDAILDYVSSSISPTTQATGTLSWNIGTIAPFQSGEILVTLNVNSPMETPAVNGGDVLSYTATANGLTTDETQDDNSFALSQQVFNSFDPNDKTCLEGAIINPSNIGKYVHYKIRFENTGTFAAQNIVVKDMIDTTKFDIATLQMTDASHSCVTRITNPNKVEFIFENINLPFDDANNDGYVVFKIKTKPTLTQNSTISNLANIYFDYNFPIVTNTATSTFTTLSNDTFEFDNYFTIYPNPAKDILTLKAKQDTQILSLSIYTTVGQLVQTVVNPTTTLDVADLKTGTYFVKMTTDKGVSSSKFVKE